MTEANTDLWCKILHALSTYAMFTKSERSRANIEDIIKQLQKYELTPIDIMKYDEENNGRAKF